MKTDEKSSVVLVLLGKSGDALFTRKSLKFDWGFPTERMETGETPGETVARALRRVGIKAFPRQITYVTYDQQQEIDDRQVYMHTYQIYYVRIEKLNGIEDSEKQKIYKMVEDANPFFPKIATPPGFNNKHQFFLKALLTVFQKRFDAGEPHNPYHF